MDNKYKRLGKNSAFVFIGNVGGRSIMLLMMPFYTRWLSQADYGASEMIQCYAVVLLDIISLCINSGIFIYPKQAEEKNRSGYFMSGLAYSAVPIICITLTLWLISRCMPPENVFSKHFSLIILLSATWFLQNYIQNFVRAIDKMKVYSFTGIINTSTIAILGFFLIPMYGLSGFVIAYALANLITASYSFFAAGLYRYVSLNIHWHYYKEMLAYTFPLVFNVIITFMGAYLNRPLLETYHGLDVMGNFAVANKFSSIIYSLIPIFGLAWQASVIEEFGSVGYGRFYNKTWSALFMFFICLCFLLIPFYPLLLYVFAAPQYAQVYLYMPAMVIHIPMSLYVFYAQANFLATRQSKKILKCTIIVAIVSVVSNLCLVPPFGIWGVIAAQVLTGVVNVGIYTFETRNLVHLVHTHRYIVLLVLYGALSISINFIENTYANIIGMTIVFILIAKERTLLKQFVAKILKR